jgi:hypothetical protein
MSPANDHEGRDGGMKNASIVSTAVMVLVGSAVGLCAGESETFTGVAAASGAHKLPLLLVDGKRYELKASDKADPSVTEALAKGPAEGGTRKTRCGGSQFLLDSSPRPVHPAAANAALHGKADLAGSR